MVFNAIVVSCQPNISEYMNVFLTVVVVHRYTDTCLLLRNRHSVLFSFD